MRQNKMTLTLLSFAVVLCLPRPARPQNYALTNLRQEQVAGLSQTTDGTWLPLVWQNGQMTSLLSATGGWSFMDISGLNNVGQVTGNGIINGEYREKSTGDCVTLSLLFSKMWRESMKNHRRLSWSLECRRLEVEYLEPRIPPAVIQITQIPSYGVDGFMAGKVAGVDPTMYRVAPYIQIEGVGWWTKPFFANPSVPINSDGTFVANVATGGIDNRATIFCAALIPAGQTPPQAAGAGRLPVDLNPVAIDCKQRFGSTIQFAGRSWGVKEAPVAVGPGGNHFSNNPGDLFVDTYGQLHLTIRFHDGVWWSTEVVLLDDVGYGTYSFQTTSAMGHLNPNVTFGAFTWDSFGDDGSAANPFREIDFEDSRWGNANDPTNAQMVVQPFGVSGNLLRYTIPDGVEDSALTRFFSWTPDAIQFVALQGHQSPSGYPSGSVIDQYAYLSDPSKGHYVPTEGREQFRFNLWINGGGAPSDGRSVEVVISNFAFSPLRPPVKHGTATSVNSSVMPSVIGQPVTFTAAVSAVSPGFHTPTGSVTFQDGPLTLGSAMLDSSGSATATVPTLAVGSHNITAVYGGDGNFTSSTSANFTQIVNKANTTTSAVTSSGSSVVLGMPVTFTTMVVTVGTVPLVPTGVVIFLDGTTPFGIGTLDSSGKTTLTVTSALSIGTHAIKARYEGDINFNTSTSGTPFSQAITTDLTGLTVATPLLTRQGQAFSGVVASFGTSTRLATAGDFTATITWGDEHSSSGSIAVDGHGGFMVSGNNTYALEGPYTVSVRVSARDGTQAMASATLHVGRTGPPPARLGDVADAITHSQEIYAKIATAAYHTYLRRDPEPAGLVAWTNALLHQGLTDEQMEAGFIASPEYFLNHGGTTERWVTGLYRDLLGRDPDPQGLQNWLNALKSGASRVAVAYGFEASAERGAIRITADYHAFLGREPEPGIVSVWVNAFLGGASNEAVEAGFLGSAEYFLNHYNNARDWLFAAYHDVLGRAPEDAGLNAWLAILGKG